MFNMKRPKTENRNWKSMWKLEGKFCSIIIGMKLQILIKGNYRYDDHQYSEKIIFKAIKI